MLYFTVQAFVIIIRFIIIKNKVVYIFVLETYKQERRKNQL